MRARDKFNANQLRDDLFAAANLECIVCGEYLGQHGVPQLAHRVAKTKARIENYGAEVIHSPLNMVPVCSLRCNDLVNIGNRPTETRGLIERIVRINTGRESMPNIREYYAELRREFGEKRK